MERSITDAGVDDDDILAGPLSFEIKKCDIKSYLDDLKESNPDREIIDVTFKPVDADVLNGLVRIPIESEEIRNVTFWLLKYVDNGEVRCGQIVVYNRYFNEVEFLTHLPADICALVVIKQAMEDKLAGLSELV